MDVGRVIRLAPLSGIIAVALLIAGSAVGGWSGYRPRGDAAIAIFTANPERIQAGALIGGFYALLFLVIFIGCLAAAIRRHDGDSPLAWIALGGGLVAVIALGLGYWFLNAAAFQAAGGDGISADLATVMFRLYTSMFAAFVSFGLAALFGAAGLAALRSGLFPTWLGWFSVLSAIGFMTPLHWAFEGLGLAWVVLVSLLLYRRAPEPDQAV